MGPAAGVGWAIPAPSSLQGGTWLEPPPPPSASRLQKQNPLLKNQNITRTVLGLDNSTPGRINSDLKI